MSFQSCVAVVLEQGELLTAAGLLPFVFHKVGVIVVVVVVVAVAAGGGFCLDKLSCLNPSHGYKCLEWAYRQENLGRSLTRLLVAFSLAHCE